MSRMTAIANAFLLTVAVILLAAGAFIGFRTEKLRENNFEERPLLIFVLDASTSMLCATDGKSRLDQARQCIRAIMRLSTDKDVALVTFGGEALVDFPPSPDYDGFLSALSAVKPTLSFSPGSDPGSGLALAEVLAADRQASAVLFTDGEFNIQDGHSMLAWQNRTLPLAWCVTGIGPAMPIPLGESWFRDPDTGEIALSMATENDIKRCVGLSDAPSRRFDSTQPPAAIDALLSEIQPTTSQILSNSTMPLPERICALQAAAILLFIMILQNCHRRVLHVMVPMLLFLSIGCSQRENASEHAHSLSNRIIEEWTSAEQANNEQEALVHISAGIALCKEALRLAPNESTVHSANLKLFLAREAQLKVPKDVAPSAVPSDNPSRETQHQSDKKEQTTKDADSQQDTIADDVLGLAGDIAPARTLPDELKKMKAETTGKTSGDVDNASADSWRSLLQKERGMRKRPPNVKPW